MRIIIYCDLCEKEYIIDVGQPWVGLMTCPHEVEHHKLREVLDDEETNSRRN